VLIRVTNSGEEVRYSSHKARNNVIPRERLRPVPPLDWALALEAQLQARTAHIAR